MYISRKQPSNRGPIIAGLLAFLLTLAVILGVAVIKSPDRLFAAFTLPEILTRTPTSLSQRPPTETPTLTPTRKPTSTRTVTPTFTPVATVAPTATPVPVNEHFLEARPVPPDAARSIPDWTYLYGSTQRGDRPVHHGEEFVNPVGTPLLAVGDGTVVVAGADDAPRCGEGGNEICGESLNFYGKLVIIQLDEPYKGQPVYALYGHMSQVEVNDGDHVTTGEEIGKVGSTGVAIGPHVHFETRYGVNSYGATRNSVLWMKPLPGHGALAGRVQDRNGKLVRAATVFLYADDPDATYIEDTATYQRDNFPPVNSDDEMGENWAFPDLPPGNYILRANVGGISFLRRVTVQEGKLNFVVLSTR